MEPEKVRAPNIRDVARLAGVSYQTVSRVLNDSPNIRPSTRERVLEVIEDLGYRPNQAARALVTNRSGTIGVLAGETAHYGPTTSVHAIEVAARHAGYRVAITNTADDYESIRSGLEYLRLQAVEAIVILATQVRLFEAITELDLTIPFVTLDSSQRDLSHSMAVDQFAGGQLAARHLIDLGHTEIEHIAGPKDWIEADGRMSGFLHEINEAELSTRPPILGDWTADFGYHAGREMVSHRDFSAVFCANDQMALGLIHAFHEAGIRVPQDVSIVGFDDIPDSAHMWPPLTTIRQDFAEVGRRAVSIILDALNGTDTASHALIAPVLVRRSSTSAFSGDGSIAPPSLRGPW